MSGAGERQAPVRVGIAGYGTGGMNFHAPFAEAANSPHSDPAEDGQRAHSVAYVLAAGGALPDNVGRRQLLNDPTAMRFPNGDIWIHVRASNVFAILSHVASGGGGKFVFWAWTYAIAYPPPQMQELTRAISRAHPDRPSAARSGCRGRN